MSIDFPTWAQKQTYLAEATAGMDKVRADVAADTTNVWQSIDETIAALHKLRNAAGAEQMKRHDEMVARMEAEEAARLARPADPTPEVVAEVQKWVDLGFPVSARLTLRDHTSMSLAAATEYVEGLSGSREGAAT